LNINIVCEGGYLTSTVEYGDHIASSSLRSSEAQEMELYELAKDLTRRLNMCIQTIEEKIDEESNNP
jgi:hypothetical protein